MRTKCLISILILLSAADGLSAQPDSLWSRTYGGEGGEACYSAIQKDNGNFTLAGWTRSIGDGRSDYWLVETDSEGDIVRSRTFGGEDNDDCYSHIITMDGGFALAGTTKSFGLGDSNCWLLRCDIGFDSLWSSIYGGKMGRMLIQTTDSGFALAGTRSFGESNNDFWIIRINESGEELWSRSFGGENTELCNSIVQTADSGFVLAGETFSRGAGEADFWLVKTNINGNLVWSSTFGGDGSDKCQTLIQTIDGGFALAGGTESFGSGEQDFWLVRTNENGDSLWSRTFGGESQDICYSIIQTAEGGFVLAGLTSSFGVGNFDFWLVRTNENGDSLWSCTFGGEGYDVCCALIQTIDGGFALAGHSESFGAGGTDFWLVKTGPDPVSVPSFDFIPHPTSLILCEPYPNPFNGMAIANCKLQIASWVGLSLYNSQGRLLRVLDKGWLAAGEHRLGVNAAGLPAGLYWLKLTDDRGRMAMQPAVLVK